MSKTRPTTRPHLQHHGLVELPNGGRPGLYWLRLFQRRARRFAVLTEVPGNPGQSVTNAAERLAALLVSDFEVNARQLGYYEVWPRGSPVLETPHVSRVRFGRNPRWFESSWRAVRRVVGGQIPALPDHQDLYALVLAHGGGVWETQSRPIFETVAPRSLPYPHNPASCAHAARFDEILDRVVRARGATDRAYEEAGRTFIASLSEEDIGACRFHRADWRRIASVASTLVRSVGRAEPEAYVAAAQQLKLAPRERRWLASLFRDPIRSAGHHFSNGQHRACALRFSGAASAVVVRRDEQLGSVCTDWTYEGDG